MNQDVVLKIEIMTEIIEKKKSSKTEKKLINSVLSTLVATKKSQPGELQLTWA